MQIKEDKCECLGDCQDLLWSRFLAMIASSHVATNWLPVPGQEVTIMVMHVCHGQSAVDRPFWTQLSSISCLKEPVAEHSRSIMAMTNMHDQWGQPQDHPKSWLISFTIPTKLTLNDIEAMFTTLAWFLPTSTNILFQGRSAIPCRLASFIRT